MIEDLWRGAIVGVVIFILNRIPWAIERLSRKDQE